uniref:Xin actin binding repeat containing 1 n=1 Tax=Seriola lalandi dorsalis TaxID=1841481 RepID=A0A3B4WJW4_SERLL
MADAARKITVSQSSHGEEDLPLPPPPPVPPRPLDYEGSLPLPPPKETFSTFYQQRQKSELKRLFKHIHPDLRASLDDVADDDIMKAVQSENAADAAYQGEVQSMRWIFENWTLDNIGDPHATKKLLDDEELKGGDVRGTSSMFEYTDGTQQMSAKRQTSVRGDVRTSTWLFETQPLDSLNESKREEGELVEAVLKEPIQPGDVRGTRLLFESQSLSDLGRCNSVEDYSFLKLRSELQEQKGEVQKTVKLFQAEPCCAIRDNSGNIHEIKSICREEINSNNISTARWLFETQPLDLINKGTDGVKIIRGISLEEGHRGGVDQKRWMFETQPFDTIQEVVGVDKFEGTVAECEGEADVVNKRKFFEMKPLEVLKGDSAEKQEIIGGDVKTSLWLFETQPMETLSDTYEVGRLKKITLSADEQGEVKGRKQMFESCSIKKDVSFKEQEIEKGDVKGFKHLFETIPLSKLAHSDEEIVEKENTITAGNVKGNTAMFETTPLYAIKDSSGNLHKVTTVSREEFIKGKVQNYKWMFETKPLDELAEGKGNVEVIKGITRQEDTMGDVKTAKWLFETQTIDGIHSKFNKIEQNTSAAEEPSKGDVKTCKWLFETQPMDILYDKSEKVKDKEAIDNADVKSITWLFESQPLDSIKDGEEYNLKLCSTIQDSVKSEVGVQTVKHLFETETLDRIRKDTNSEQDMRCVSQVNFQSGDVSRVKELFESQSLDEIGSEIVRTSDEQTQDEQIEKGSVHKFTWMFENCPMNLINKDNDADSQGVSGTESGDVQNKRFVFETSSLDKIQHEPLEQNGIIIEANESSNVNMAKYVLEGNDGVQIQNEEVVGGNIRNIMLQLLLKPTLKPQVTLLREVEQGKVNTTVVELPVYQSATTINLEKDQRIQNIVQMIDELLVQDKVLKKGIIMQETAGGQAEMTAASCIEKGGLDNLKSLHTELSGDEADDSLLAKEQTEIVHGDVKEAKRSLCQQKDQVERTISDVLPGDVRNTKKVFSSECSFSIDTCVPKEEIIPGDVSSAKQQLAVKQPVMVEKEEIVAGDIKATLQSLERAKQQSMCVEREIIQPGTIYDMDLSAQCPDIEGSPAQKEVIISGDVKAAKKSLEMAKQQSMNMEREVIVPGKIYNLNVSAQEGSSSAAMQSTCSSSSGCQQIRTCPKVSDAVKDQGSHVSFEACQQRAVIVSNCAAGSLPLFESYECNGQTTEDETEEVIRGDVKAAIRSLQSAATEQKLLDKEDIVRGNVQLALQSLEKSSVNVSKGDYKAAMIYRNSGRACSGRSETVHKQCVVVSVPPSDTKLSPSISVTCEGQPPNTTQNSTPNPVANGNSKSSCSETVNPPPLPQKTSEKPREQKPALPPKPQWTKSVVVEGPNIPLPPAPEVACPIEDNGKSVGIPPKQNKQFPTPFTDNLQANKTNKETLHETYNQKCVDETVQDSSQSKEHLQMNSKTQEIKKTQKTTPLKKSECQVTNSTVEMERNVIQKINAAEEIQMCMKNYAEDGKQEMSMSLQAALQNFERKESESLDRRVPLLSKKVKVINDSDNKYTNKTTIQQHKSNPEPVKKQHSKTEVQMSDTNSRVDARHLQQNDLNGQHQKVEDRVVLREKKVKETEDERRQRLSVHKEEIMKGNVKAAMEIFENLRKREELKGILCQVQEIEGETSSVDVSSLKTLYQNVPAWMVTPSRNAKQKSISSVETAFEDLEKASKEIMNLKEETLAKLLDIEEAIKKALYSVSNLKSEADIAGLSGLFDESLESERNLQPANNIRKISIVSSKAKSGQTKDTTDVNLQTVSDSSPSRQEVPRQVPNKPLIRQSSSQSSPSFISIHSAARKPAEQPKSPMSTFKPKAECSSQSCHDANSDLGQESAAESSKNVYSPVQRKVSVLEVKTVPEKPAGIIGTKTVSETYEETDGFGNVFVSSMTSTFVTKQSDAKSSALFEVVGSPTRYKVMTSPLMRRSGRPFEDNAKEEGTVFVTFSQPKEKH